LTIDTTAAPAATAAWLEHLHRTSDLRRNSTTTSPSPTPTTKQQQQQQQQQHATLHERRRVRTANPKYGGGAKVISSDEESVDSADEANQIHTCAWCPKKFVTSGHLKQHVRTHTGDRPFPCSWCDKAFAQCGDLKRHERIHTGEKPFECKSCGKAFAQCGNLKKHERIHARGGGSNSLITGSPRGAAASASASASASSNLVKSPAASTKVTTPAPIAVVKSATPIAPTPTPTRISGRTKRTSTKRPAEEDVADVETNHDGIDAEDIDDADGDGDDSEADFGGAALGNGSESRVERSRRNAREGRARKKQYIEQLETKLIKMESRDTSLRDELERNQLLLSTLQAKHLGLVGSA
jgi:hypothetical protein